MEKLVHIPSKDRVQEAYNKMFDLRTCVSEDTTLKEMQLIAVMLNIGRSVLTEMEGSTMRTPTMLMCIDDELRYYERFPNYELPEYLKAYKESKYKE